MMQLLPVKDNFNTPLTEATKEEWLTPPNLIKALGPFDLDPCAPPASRRPWDMATRHYCGAGEGEGAEAVDGLLAPWVGRVWLNPPYGKETFKWMRRLAEHKSGVALIFARTETKGFHDEIWRKAHSVFFFRGRLSFFHVTGEKGGTSNAPSCLVSYHEEDTLRIHLSGIVGKLVTL